MKKKYTYNPITEKYEEYKTTWKTRLLIIFILSLVAGALGYTASTMVYYTFGTPEERVLNRELEYMRLQYKIMSDKLDNMELLVNEMQTHDDNIYRSIFGVEPIPTSVREAGRGGTNRYEALEGYSHSEEIIEIAEKIDKFSSQLYVQSKSFDEIYEIAKTKEDMMKHVPAIMPVKRTTIYGISSHFGYRTDPFYKVNKMHSGIDFSGPKGSPIYATGDGVVEKTVKSKTGYGNNIIINHGYGYKTRYAHLNSINVKKGDKIKRGQKIGTLGNTGKSSGPHLHYEVIKNNVPVNPINFFYNDLTPEMYDKIIELSKTPHQSMD